MLEDGCDIICVNLVDRTEPVTIIDMAEKKDVPVIFFNRELVEQDLERWDKLYYVGAKAFESGIMQGEMAADIFKKDPAADKNGDCLLYTSSYLVWIALVVAAITWFIFNMTRHGKYMYAIGGNPQAAEVAGVPVKLTLILIYMKAAAMYGLAGFMLGAKSGGASVQLGYGYEMEAIAACTIGGVSVTGGRGKVSSAFVGVAVFELSLIHI